MSEPIWKDYTVTLGSADAYDFEIRLDNAAGQLIFSGRAYKRPGATNVEVRINDVCAAYLHTLLPDPMQAGVFDDDIQRTFVVLYETGGVWTTADTVDFYNDWSYDNGFDPATDKLPDPVLKKLDPRQMLLFSALPGATLTGTVYLAGGTTSAVSASLPNGGTYVLDLSSYIKPVKVTLGGITWEVADFCRRFSAYYVNAYGGWDCLLLDGVDARADALTRHTTLKEYDNGDPSARGRKDYAIEYAPAWTLNTGILSDLESSRMHHLLESPQVYLYDFVDGVFLPVVLTDVEDVRQTYRGNGRRPAQYTFTAQLAQERFRR